MSFLEEKYIQFIANYDDWVSIKKLKIEPTTDPRQVMEFLASFCTSVDKKVEENLRKTVDLGKLDKALEEIAFSKKGEGISKVIESASSGKINSTAKEISSIEGLQKGEQKEIEGFCKVYAMRKALKKCGLNVDYSEIEIPGMKRLTKKKE